MEAQEICRRNDLPLLGKPLSPKHYDDPYCHPFETLPLLKSHLHPKFVIFDAGRKLASLEGAAFHKLTADFPILNVVLSLYKGWIRKLPQSHVNDPSYAPPVIPEDDDISSDDDDSSDDDYDDTRSNRTKFRRSGYKWKGPAVAPIASAKRRRSNQGQVGGKRKVLSEMSLSTHNQQLGTANWDDRICEWSLNCTKKKTKKAKREDIKFPPCS